jgi:hypothetical protein
MAKSKEELKFNVKTIMHEPKQDSEEVEANALVQGLSEGKLRLQKQLDKI